VSKVKKNPISVRVKVNNTNDIKLMKYSRPLVATILMSGGLFQLVAPVLAEGTAAATPISNTATASYDDPTGAGSINATSNTVTVTVAEVAGLIVTATNITNGNGTNTPGTIVAGNSLYYNYTITNVGNNATTFRIPGTATVSGPATLNSTSALSGLQYSIDGGANWLPVALGGTTTPLVGVNGSVLVRVGVTVNSNTGSTVSVRLGNTGPSDLSNVVYSDSNNSDDVYTVGGNPANSQREGSDTLSGTVGSTAKNIALATVLATRTATSNNGTQNALNDDTVTYGLKLKVEDTDVTSSGITPSALTGTDITVGGTTAKRILVSNAIPNGTTIKTPATAPSGWTAVYTSSPLTGAGATTANLATWSTAFSATPATPYTRVGFVSDIGAIVAPSATPLDGFEFTVTTTGAPAVAAAGDTYTVNSMAQAFGVTSGGDATVIVYDESGDQTPNAEYSLSTPLTTTTSTFTGALGASGVAFATYGVDTSNNNTGSGEYGEINQFTVTYTAPTPSSLLNGPAGAPQAQGPDALGALSSDFDFTNKSSAVPAGVGPFETNGTTPSTIDPAIVGFTNTVRNTGTAQSNIALLPEKLSPSNLPNGTQVRIYTAAGQSATYVVTATGFAFVANTGVGTVGGVAISAGVPVTLENVAPNTTATYQVAIDLPAATPLSTNTLKGFGVVINAFIGGTVSTTGDATVTGSSASNKTIDRVYTGFIKLAKETLILPGTGPAVAPSDATFSATAKTPAAGNIIQYRITYTNISEEQVGNDNGVLNAGNLAIVEDGTTTGNKWGQDGDSNGTIDTSNVVGSAVKTGPSSTIELYKGADGLTTTNIDQTGTTANSDITRYVNRLTTTTVVAPGISGTFSFQRKLN
jgi:hypothetical protein